MVRILVRGVGRRLGVRRGFPLLDQQDSAAQHSQKNDGDQESVGFMALSPLPPGGHAGADHDQREDHDAEPEDR